MASWEKYLEGNYDGNNTEMEEQKTEDKYEAREVAEKITELFEQYKKRSDIKKYLVEGAVLRCSKATTNPFYLQDGTEIKLENIDNETEDEKIKRQRTLLYVKEKDAKMMVGDYLYATVLDAEKGELEELIEKEKKGNKRFLEANIYPFQCNCLEPADRAAEEKIIKENKEQCMKYGVCQYLMRLNTVWENVPLPVGSFFETRERNGQREDAECITMTSMIFCKHGGLITPERSGQEERKKSVDLNIIKRYLGEGTVDEGSVENALIDLARISEKQLPLYTSKSGHNYNRYDIFIIGWCEYYKYKYRVEIEPRVIKSQLYNETRIGCTKSGNIPAANANRDIMQALDIRNYNIYNYTDIAPNEFVAGTSSGQDMTGLWIWNQNLGANGYAAPVGGIQNFQKYRRCKGIVASLFVPQGENSYKFVYENVTPVMSIGVGMDLMMELVEANGIEKALALYNQGSDPEGYRNDIIARAEGGEFQGD